MLDLQNLEFGEKFGFSEMFEWDEQVKTEFPYHCKLVQFSEEHPEKIIRARSIKNIVGISTINSAFKASNPNEWPFKYIINEYGDLYLKPSTIAEATKKYDDVNEFSYLETHKKSVILPVNNPDFDEDKKYIKRQSRGEWSTVTLIGKAIIEDNGKCEPGKYCTLYQGEEDRMFGTVIPAKKTDKFKLYVLDRISDHTIIVLYIPQIYSTEK